MQLLMSTGREVGVASIDRDADANIHAGAAYMRRLADAYVNGPQLDAINRVLMTFAAYNAGPGTLLKCRVLAKRDGFDPNVWFDNVEGEIAKTIGAETVTYVGNIYKYYVGYSLLLERKAAEDAARRQIDTGAPHESSPGGSP
jgi:membrane-bound lytic murein transglycosylase MltF